MKVKSLVVLAICLLLIFSTTVLAEPEEVLPQELNNDAFKNACLQCHVFNGKFFGDNPKRKRGSIYGEKVGEDPELGFETRKIRTDLSKLKCQKVATMMSMEALIAVIDSSMMAPMTDKEKESVRVAAEIYRSYAEKNLNDKIKS